MSFGTFWAGLIKPFSPAGTTVAGGLTVITTLTPGIAGNNINHAVGKPVKTLTIVNLTGDNIGNEFTNVDNDNVKVFIAGGTPVVNAKINMIFWS